MNTFQVINGGNVHSPGRKGACAACAAEFPAACECGDGRLHAEVHPIPGGWGPVPIRYRCDRCGQARPRQAEAG